VSGPSTPDYTSVFYATSVGKHFGKAHRSLSLKYFMAGITFRNYYVRRLSRVNLSFSLSYMDCGAHV